jgi:hypothetical protein
MPERKPKPPTKEQPPEEFTRFQRLARALFRVDKRDALQSEHEKQNQAVK